MRIRETVSAVTTMEFRTLKTQRRVGRKLSTVAFRRADLVLFKDLLKRVPWDKALEKRGSKKAG